MDEIRVHQQAEIRVKSRFQNLAFLDVNPRKLRADNAAPDGGHGRLGAARRAEFLQQVVDMTSDGGFRDIEQVGNFPVGQALNNVFKNIDFSLSKPLSAPSRG